MQRNRIRKLVSKSGIAMIENLEQRQLLSGAISTIALEIGATPESVIFADFTNDGITDTAVLAPDLGEIQIWAPDKQGNVNKWATIKDNFMDAHRLQVLDINADGVPDLGVFDAGTHRFSTYLNNNDTTFSAAGGIQLADTATGFIFIYDAQGPVAEPVGPWIGSSDYGASRDGFGEGGDSGGGNDNGGNGNGNDNGNGGNGNGGNGNDNGGNGNGNDNGNGGNGNDNGNGGNGNGNDNGNGGNGNGNGNDNGNGGNGNGNGNGGNGNGNGNGGNGGNGSFAHFVGEPFIAVWHDSLNALQIVDSSLLLDQNGAGNGNSGQGGDGSGNAVAWPFQNRYINLPTGLYFATGSGGDAMVVKDFNNNGMPDIAVTNRNDNTISIITLKPEYQSLMQGGYDPAVDGLLSTDTINVGKEPVHINAFDVNLDGLMDMIVSNAGDGTFTILEQTGTSFGNPQTVSVAPGVTQAFLNFNSFGNELFVLGFSANGTVTRLDFANGTLLPSTQQQTQLLANDTALPRQTIVGEFTGDGFTDIAAIDQAGGRVVIYSNVDGQANDGGDQYGGPPVDARDIPIPGVPDLNAVSDSGSSNSDNITAFNNADNFKLAFDVPVSHVSSELANLRTILDTFFTQHGAQFDQDGFEFKPTVWVNLFAGNIYIGSAEVGANDTVVTVMTDGETVLREGNHDIRAGFSIGASGYRGLLGTRSGTLGIEVRVPHVEIEAPDDNGDSVTIKQDASGKPVLVLAKADGTGQAEEVHLGDFKDLPEITGSVVTVRETKTHAKASRYAAAPSRDGLVLFDRDQKGKWAGRNLTAEIKDSEPITESNLEVLTTPWGNVNMAGLNKQGELVFYWQDGGVDTNGDANWNFVNLADDQLRTNNQAVPKFASSLSSFVTSWGAMNVAGLDTNGHLRVIWWAPGMDNWVSTDLTNVLGSTPLTGDISTWVTPWGGINITGLNTNGEMVAVWWAPGGEWTVTPLGQDLGAPALVHGSLTSIISDTGKTFISGLTVTGDVGIFNWAPGDNAWDYVTIDTIPTSATLVGSVTGFYTSQTDTVTLMVGSVNGDIYQLGGDANNIQSLWDVGLFTG